MANHVRGHESEAFDFNARPVVVTVSGERYLPNSGRLFYVHPNVLRSSSQHFRDLIPLNGHNHEQRIEVSETDIRIFGIYLHFLYFGKILSNWDDYSYDLTSEYEVLFRLYTFADAVKNVKVMDATIGAIMARSASTEGNFNRLPDWDAIEHVYARTKRDSHLRRLAVDIYIWFGGEGDIDCFEDKYSEPEFIFDLASALLKKGGAVRDQTAIPAEVTICDYHDPGDCEVCAGKKRKRAVSEE